MLTASLLVAVLACASSNASSLHAKLRLWCAVLLAKNGCGAAGASGAWVCVPPPRP